MTEKEIFKSGTSTKSIRNSFISFTFFGIIAIYLFATTKTHNDISVALISFFGIFAIATLIPLFWKKEIILTEERLIINWKFFARTKVYYLNDIESIDEDAYSIDTTTNYTETNIHKGRKAKISFKNTSKQLTLDSYENENYYILINKLKGITKKMSADFVGDIDEYGEFEQRIYGRENKFWFVFLFLIIGFLVYGILKTIYSG